MFLTIDICYKRWSAVGWQYGLVLPISVLWLIWEYDSEFVLEFAGRGSVWCEWWVVRDAHNVDSNVMMCITDSKDMM